MPFPYLLRRGEKKNDITPMQAEFVRQLPLCITHTEAARKAGFANPSQASTRLLKDKKFEKQYRHVRDAYKKQQERLDKQVGLTLEKKKEILAEIARGKGTKPRDRMGAIDIDNKMESVYIQRTRREDMPPDEIIAKMIKKFDKLGYDVIKREKKE